ncbi:checkpoint clamp complex protein Rad1, partial [Coemansia nantahalensis]
MAALPGRAGTAATANPEHMLLTARLNNIRPLVNMLRTICFRPRALCAINASGLVFSVEEAQSIVAEAYLRTDLFATFNYNLALAREQRRARQNGADEESADPDDTTYVSLPLDNLIECLMLFYGPSGGTAGGHSSGIQTTSAMLTGGNPMDLRGASTAHIAFNGLGSDFELMLEERGVISVCRLATFFPETPVNLDFSRSPVVQQLIIRSEWLRDAFNELDPSSEA